MGVCLVFLVSSLLLWIMAWGVHWGLHLIHSSMQVYNCMHGWVIKALELESLTLAHHLTGRKRHLLRLGGVGLKTEKSHLKSWQLHGLSRDGDLEVKKRWTCQQEHEKLVRAAAMERKQERNNAAVASLCKQSRSGAMDLMILFLVT